MASEMMRGRRSSRLGQLSPLHLQGSTWILRSRWSGRGSTRSRCGLCHPIWILEFHRLQLKIRDIFRYKEFLPTTSFIMSMGVYLYGRSLPFVSLQSQERRRGEFEQSLQKRTRMDQICHTDKQH